MNRLIFAAIYGLLLSLPVSSLQAQKPVELDEAPVFRAEPQRNELTLQLGTGQQVHEQEPSADLAKYPIWLLIKPDGIQFLQNQEEIATNQNAIPRNAFLLGCMTVKFEGASVEQKPNFQLSCEEFLLMGRYGTKQNLDVKGASLTFSTKSKQIRLTGTEKLPLELHSIDEASETRMRADEITLQLDSGLATVTRFETRNYLDPKSGQQKTAQFPITEQRSYGSNFQLSARNITALEVIANPAPEEDAPRWTPDSPGRGNGPANAPTPISNESPFYEPPRKMNKLPTY
jgi:hypothetical protein